MNITKIPKSVTPNSFKRFVKSEYLAAVCYCKDPKDKDERDGGKFNLTTGGSARDKKESAKEENFFYKQSLEQLKALKQKFFKNDPNKKGDK